MQRGLFIGRFQPLHFGHISVIKDILKEVDELVIVIAAAQFSHTPKNPLTAGERLVMLKKGLIELAVSMDNIWLLTAQDILDNMLWVPHVRRLIPKVSCLYTNNPFTRRLWEENDVQTKETQVYDREKFSATTIRSCILEGKPLDKLVPQSTIQLLNDFDIQGRLHAVTSDEVELAKQAGPEFLLDK